MNDASAPGAATPPKTEEKPAPTDERQWQLALAYLERAERSADLLRLALFVAAAGFAALLLLEIVAGLSRVLVIGHIAASGLCALAMCLVFRAWRGQSEKARERFKYLRAKDYDNYLQYDSAAEQIGGKNAAAADRLAFLCLLAALMVEIVIRSLASAGSINV